MSKFNGENFQFGKEIENNYNIVIEEYYRQIRETEKFWNQDNYQALKIQAYYKIYFARIKENEINKKNLEYFSNQATIIQRHFRGFHTRKYVHDFFARKQFLKLLQNKNEVFLQDLKATSEQERVEEERRQEAIARGEFNELAKNLHHLTSTNQIPGVYNPPYAQQKKTAFNIEVEMHLQATFKANYKWKPPTKDDIQKYSIRPQKPGQLKPMTKRPSSGLNSQMGTQQYGTQNNYNNTNNKNINNTNSLRNKSQLSQKSLQAVQ
ncbi:hypothetical protein PPERSA_11918 [Pseudocohnilembus persalinus]|uniref:IQ motif, EF-hand binding site n=1 Tax=Pseudocohnilembus persalinus TaxID=266149 RepID=A0A0V0QK81_PSEPJ|nr:hypothetical protein PPERSA_11918 [Pseudocohnilembus persalinus]|eukprot:KRX02578.1 hypothetical protein PPERSA_11918 [Pseudocohnilembus persalinus]